MSIEHHPTKYRFDGARDAIRFTFSDGTRDIVCMVLRSCFEEDFGVKTDEVLDWLAACSDHESDLEFAARELWRHGAPEPVVVRSGNVRIWGRRNHVDRVTDF